MFQINGFLKFSEEDNYEGGCNPDTAESYPVDVFLTGETTKAVIERAAEFLGVDKDGIEINACNEKGRVDFSKMEDNEGTTPSESQISAWKKGRENLYAVTYTAYVEKVTPAKL